MLDWKEAPAPDTGDRGTGPHGMPGLPPNSPAPPRRWCCASSFASDEFLDELEIDDPLELTGLYDGVPMTEKIAQRSAAFPRHGLAVSPRHPG